MAIIKSNNVQNQPKIGQGIYTVPDIAMILKLPKVKVRRWINDYWNCKFNNENFNYTWGQGRDLGMDFYMLIEFYIFYKLREYGISINKIVKAHNIILKDINCNYPFANSTILTDGNLIFYTPKFEADIIKADDTKQLALVEIIRGFLKKIDFDSESLAQRFWPLGKDKNIVIDPHHQFGQPVIQGTNILAETIYSLYKAGENIKVISKLYDISEQSVLEANQFFQKVS